jgi:CheY-like chemotaxis protein
MKIMVVDDEPDVQMLFQQRFRRELKEGRISFLFALSGEEALSLLRQWAADVVLILSDINMPGMNGLDLLKTVKDRHGHLKVYMITAYGDESNRLRAQEYGCDDYFVKPIDFGVLREKLVTEGV